MKQRTPDLFDDSAESAHLNARGDSGAPGALKAIEMHELKCRQLVATAEREWKAAYEKIVDEDKISVERSDRLRRDYLAALEMWHESTKKLGEYDKFVKPERREGEKVTVSEAKEIFSQLMLSIDLAVEQYIVAIAQGAALCGSPEEFHVAHAGMIRAAKDGAIDAAKREGALPGWIL